MRTEAFWMVYGDGQRVPTYKHESEVAAVREAEHLATANPGVPFYVLRATEVFRSIKPVERFILTEPVPF